MRRIVFLVLFLFSLAVVSGTEDVVVSIKNEWWRTKLLDKNTPLEKKVEYADSLAAIEQGRDLLGLYIIKADALYYLGRYREALKVEDELKPLIPRDSLRLRLRSEFMSGMLAFTVSDYHRAVETAYKMLACEKPDELRYFDFYACTILEDFYEHAKDFNRAWKYLGIARRVLDESPAGPGFPESECNRHKAGWYNMAAELYLKEGKLNEAYKTCQIGSRYATNDVGRLSNLVIAAEIAAAKKEHEVADDYFRRALEIKTGNFQKCCAVVGYMKLLLERGMPDSAMAVMDDYAVDVAKIAGTPLEREHLDNLKWYYDLKGDYRRQTETLESIVALTDSLYQSASMNGVIGLADQYESMGTQRELSRLAADIRSKAWIILGLVLLLLAVVVVIFVAVRKLRRRKAEAQLFDGKIEELGREYDHSLREVNESLESQSQQLSSMTMFMARFNEALSDIKREADDRGSSETSRLDRIRAIVGNFRREENLWDLFSVYFEQVNQTFFDRLFQVCRSLTKAEVRMCAFILLNMTNKEIAILTNRSVRTVETIKYNLRKKLAITGSSEMYMRHLSTADSDELARLRAQADSGRE